VTVDKALPSTIGSSRRGPSLGLMPSPIHRPAPRTDAAATRDEPKESGSYHFSAHNFISLVGTHFVDEALARGFSFYASRRVRLDKDLELDQVVAQGDLRWWAHCVNCAPHDIVCDGFLRDRHADAIVRLDNEHDGDVVVGVASASMTTTAQALARWAELVSGPASLKESEVALQFATVQKHNAFAMRSRGISAPAWAEIRDNYVAAVVDELDRLCAYRPDGQGQLLLWRGAPGTGKTHAVRALIRAWSAWCRPVYVTDPEQLFGGSQDYMLDLVVGQEDAERPWQLLIVEDAGELIAIDARETSGQALSRLLNVSDGLIGQSSNTLILLTTNEDIGRLHPAVHRAGRCLSDCEFAELPMEQATAWLTDRGADEVVTRPMALAELYALVHDHPRRAADARFGFAGHATERA
jgi:hypothetical protein